MGVGSWWRVAPLVLVLGGTACRATSTVTSVRDPNYVGLVHQLFVSVGQGPAPGYPDSLAGHLRAELARHHVLSNVRVLRAGTVNAKELLADVARSKPDGLLVIQIVHGVLKRGIPVELTYEAVLTDAKQGDRIWSARIDVRRATGPDGTGDEFMTEVARQVTQRLTVDRLIEAAPAGTDAKGD